MLTAPPFFTSFIPRFCSFSSSPMSRVQELNEHLLPGEAEREKKKLSSPIVLSHTISLSNKTGLKPLPDMLSSHRIASLVPSGTSNAPIPLSVCSLENGERFICEYRVTKTMPHIAPYSAAYRANARFPERGDR